MRMSSDDIQHYPQCTKLLQTLTVTLKKGAVLKAFLRACSDGAPKPAIAEGIAMNKALRWGENPLISIKEDMTRIPIGHGQIGEACGYTPPFDGSRHLVLITSVWFDGVEFGSAFDRPANEGRLVRTFLHEAVHWVREKAGAPDEIQIGGYYKGKAMEAGHQFEEWAYGTGNICTRAELDDAIASRRL
jgi:hypothetical protein